MSYEKELRKMVVKDYNFGASLAPPISKIKQIFLQNIDKLKKMKLEDIVPLRNPKIRKMMEPLEKQYKDMYNFGDGGRAPVDYYADRFYEALESIKGQLKKK